MPRSDRWALRLLRLLRSRYSLNTCCAAYALATMPASVMVWVTASSVMTYFLGRLRYTAF